MCGIVGSASVPGSVRRVRQDTLRRAADTLRHRGPDDAGVWISDDGRVGLAHRRLAIIDLSSAGCQPMADPDGGVHMVFNGEIYNFRELRAELSRHGYPFRSHTDSEVVLAAYCRWGTACVEQLVGMFAFAIYDEKAQRLFCARDRAGEKPFFYWQDNDQFAFASELKALLLDTSLPRVLDPGAVDAYFAYGFVPGSACILAGVHKLPPAHALTFNVATGDRTVWRYWQPAAPAKDHANPDELLERLRTLLSQAVRQQLVADVPVGVLLSGGIDSSIVAALAQQAAAVQVNTYTVTFPGFPAYDEACHARAVAAHIGSRHTELNADDTSIDLLPTLARQFDEPIADSSMIPTFLVARLIREHAVVALGGDGGDELFGGYHHYRWIQQQVRLRAITPAFVRAAVSSAASFLPPGTRGRNYMLGARGSVANGVAHINVIFDARSRRALLRPMSVDIPDIGNAEELKRALCAPAATPYQMAAAVDFQTYMAEDILVKVDRASMLASLEVRAPFLDYRIIDFAFGEVPDSLKTTTRERKILLRRLAAQLLPPSHDLVRKQGFSIPLASMLRQQWRSEVRDILETVPPDVFDRAWIRRLLDAHDRGYDNAHRIFALTFFELWRRTYAVTRA